MARFTPVTDTHRLWLVEDLLPPDQATEVLATDWLSLSWTRGTQQASWPRRQIARDDPTAQRLGDYINQTLPEINQALGTTFNKSVGKFWVDEPGFTVDMHTDGHVANAMHLYWNMPYNSLDYGTGFYHFKNTDSLLYQFSSRANTGYIMLNHLNADGSQPLHWHGMFCPVPENTIRVASYWQFE
jgi:hypothetical protein